MLPSFADLFDGFLFGKDGELLFGRRAIRALVGRFFPIVDIAANRTFPNHDFPPPFYRDAVIQESVYHLKKPLKPFYHIKSIISL